MSDEIQDLSKPCIDSNANDMFKAQKGTKHIVKIVHVTSVVQPLFYNDTRIFFFQTDTGRVKDWNFFDQVGYKLFQNILSGLYTSCILFISYKMICLSCAAVKYFIVVLFSA